MLISKNYFSTKTTSSLDYSIKILNSPAGSGKTYLAEQLILGKKFIFLPTSFHNSNLFFSYLELMLSKTLIDLVKGSIKNMNLMS
jgi:hypothetical protein